MLANQPQEKWKWHIGGNGSTTTMPQCKGVMSTDCQADLLRELHVLDFIFLIFKSNDCFFRLVLQSNDYFFKSVYDFD